MLIAQSCPICNPMDCSPQASSVHGILQERILEWVATPFNMEFSWPRNQMWVSCITGKFFTIWASSKVILSILGNSKMKIKHRWSYHWKLKKLTALSAKLNKILHQEGTVTSSGQQWFPQSCGKTWWFLEHGQKQQNEEKGK